MSTTHTQAIMAKLGLSYPVPSDAAVQVDLPEQWWKILLLYALNAVFGAQKALPTPSPSVAGDSATATAGTATITYAAAGAGVANVISGVVWSYSGSDTLPKGSTPGTLTISDGATAKLSIDITASGPGFIPITPPIQGTANTAMTVTLSSGGTSVVGKVTARHSTQ